MNKERIMKTGKQRLIAAIVVSTLLASCATPTGQNTAFQGNPCPTGQTQFSPSRQPSFIQQAILNPLANIGGTLLATAAANYSQKYTGKLNKLLTKLVTPKKKRKKKNRPDSAGQGFEESFPQDQGQPFPQDQGQPFPQDQGQPFPQEEVQTEPDFPDQEQFPQDQALGNEEFPPFEEGEVQPRGVPGQFPHARFTSNPCPDQQHPQGFPTNAPPNQPYGYDPYAAQQGQPYGQEQGYDPYAAQQGQPYGQGQGYDPYAAQQGQPYGQGQGYDPYAAQQGQPYPAAPTEQPYGYAPYAQGQGVEGESYYPVGQGERAPVGLEVVLVRKTMRNGATILQPIQDGAVLKDGRGNPQAGDKFRVMFRPTADSYVYVIAIDGSGWAQGIFPPPTAPLANPVKAGEQYVLPEGNNWFSLDQFRGIETLFFVASPTQRKDIEEILQSITGRERPATATPKQVTKVAMVPYGVGAVRPSATPFGVSSGSGQDHSIMPTSYFAKKAGQDLRLTRWFRHE